MVVGVEDVCGFGLQVKDGGWLEVVGVVVDVGMCLGAAPDPEVEYHGTSGATSRLSEERLVGRW